MAFCLGGYFYGGRGCGGRGRHRSHLCLFLNWVCSINDTLRVTPLPFTVSGSIGAWASTWLLVRAQAMDTILALVSSKGQHGYRWQHRPRTSTWPLLVAWAKDINTNCWLRQNHGFCALPPGPPSWPSAAAQTANINMASGGSTGSSHQHGHPCCLLKEEILVQVSKSNQPEPTVTPTWP